MSNKVLDTVYRYNFHWRWPTNIMVFSNRTYPPKYFPINISKYKVWFTVLADKAYTFMFLSTLRELSKDNSTKDTDILSVCAKKSNYLKNLDSFTKSAWYWNPLKSPHNLGFSLPCEFSSASLNSSKVKNYICLVQSGFFNRLTSLIFARAHHVIGIIVLNFITQTLSKLVKFGPIY